MQATSGDIDRTFQISQRALELMKAYGSPADPRSYEVWYTYVSGHRPLLNDAIRRIAQENRGVTDRDIEAIYDAHLSPYRTTMEAEKTGTTMIAEIDEVVAMIEVALGSTTRYGESLQALSHDLSGTVDRTRIREILGSLVRATQDVSTTNRNLESRLKETRGEIEALRETLEAVRVEALTDPLTGMANRKHFEEMLVKSIDHAAVERSPLSLIVIDIDHFKHFNDTYGHLTGDQVLRLVSATMRDSVRSGATLARFGGEEFAVILPGITLPNAGDVAERIRESIMSRDLVKRSTGETLGKVTVSIGVAAMRTGDTSTSLLERADQCMFAAKRMGRNRTITDHESQNGQLSDVA